MGEQDQVRFYSTSVLGMKWMVIFSGRGTRYRRFKCRLWLLQWVCVAYHC